MHFPTPKKNMIAVVLLNHCALSYYDVMKSIGILWRCQEAKQAMQINPNVKEQSHQKRPEDTNRHQQCTNNVAFGSRVFLVVV
jgi:hypothetical protein